MFNAIELPSPPLRFSIPVLINSLVFLVHPDTSKTLFPHSADQGIVDRLVHVLDLVVQSYTDDELDYHGPPLIKLTHAITDCHRKLTLSKLHISHPHTLGHVCKPSFCREDILGTGDSLSASLLRLSVWKAANRLRVLIPVLLFELSDNDLQLLMHMLDMGMRLVSCRFSVWRSRRAH